MRITQELVSDYVAGRLEPAEVQSVEAAMREDREVTRAIKVAKEANERVRSKWRH
jgi:anti-sigma-K factor RskA